MRNGGFYERGGIKGVEQSSEERELAAGRVTVKVKYADFRPVTRGLLLIPPTVRPSGFAGRR